MLFMVRRQTYFLSTRLTFYLSQTSSDDEHVDNACRIPQLNITLLFQQFGRAYDFFDEYCKATLAYACIVQIISGHINTVWCVQPVFNQTVFLIFE